MSLSPNLKLDWCSYQAAKFAVEHWHYSKSMSSSKNVCVGVWEQDKFIGAIVFGIGSGNSTNGTQYGLKMQNEMAELTRVALAAHQAPVSKIVSIAIRMLKKQSPDLRLLISMADPVHGHVGSIYQAMNWIYTGVTKADVLYFSRGEWRHHRTVTSRGSAAGLPSKALPPKHRYLYPLDDAMRKQIEPLRKPYPKRAHEVNQDTASDQLAEGGATPTHALMEDSNGA